jgi:hypothetical protein
MFDVLIDMDDKMIKAHFDDECDGLVSYIAARPAERRTSYTGSAMPYANYAQAFEGTPNKGEHLIMDGFVTVNISRPNAFYTCLGRVRVPPTLYIRFKSDGAWKEYAMKLSNGAVHKRLSHPSSRRDAMFYKSLSELPVRSQERILRDSSQSHAAQSFWGLKPPV